MKSFDQTRFKKIFHQMLRIRMVEEAISARYSKQQMRCPTHLSIGQEAVAGVIGSLLNTTDLAVSTHRAHAHYLAKGGDLPALIAELHGRVTGCTQGRGGSMNLTHPESGFVASTAIVGNTIPIGVGLAFAQQLKKSKNIVAVFLGDAAVEEGAFYEALNFAVLKKLPVLFVCENNGYSVNTHFDLRQPAERKIYEMCRAIGAKTASFDGNDVFSMYSQVADAVKDVRQDGGPHLLEFATYRYKTHCGPEDDLQNGSRPTKEIEHWLDRDPIKLMQSDMLEHACINQDDIATWRAEITTEINAAFEFALASEFPSLDDCIREKYSEQDMTWLKKLLATQEEVALNG
ncbi:MAG: acetoin dehydrogenase [Coxiella sp. (in: Bacteria)]|nr:MAG: acetoin dehydrogenase [Coxiella sp. (in: g-proteobacteria)]